MIKCCVIGASGYTGAELVRLLHLHPKFELCASYVSANSQDAHASLSTLHPQLTNLVEQTLVPLEDAMLGELATTMDAIFLATPHEASHDWMATLSSGSAKVFDLSGAFRLHDSEIFKRFYGFEHQQQDILQQAVYGLAEHNHQALKSAQVVAVPGCYPTASLLALKPLVDAGLLDTSMRPIINAVSGVSGAGRKATLGNSFCEVSLQAYGVLGHRHQPEISEHLGEQVIFTPHLGNFKRGILATITVKVHEDVTADMLESAYQTAYSKQRIVRLLAHFPKLDNVVNTPHCDLHWKLDSDSGYVVIGSAIDNLLKGAASQAVQCANLAFSLHSECGLLSEVTA